MIYSDLTARLYAALNIDAGTDTDFATYLPQIVVAAELRCYRDLDLLETRKTATAAIAAGASTLPTPSDWLIGRRVAITPTTGTKRTTLDRRDDDFLHEYWPDPTFSAASYPPRYWAEPVAGTLLIAPTADQAYAAELAYIFRPATMSATNMTTVLGSGFGDLFFAACMLEGAAYQKNFGAASDDPQMAVSWKAQYETRLAAARNEVGRRKGQAYFDAGTTPPPASTQPRG